MDFDLQTILLDQFLNVSAPIDLKMGKDDQDKDLESSPPSFTADNLDLSSLNFDMSSSNTTTSNTTVATPNENLSTEGHFDLNFDFGSIDALNNDHEMSLPDETTSPFTLHKADCCSKTDDIDLNNLLNLNLDMFLTASSPVSSATTPVSVNPVPKIPVPTRPLSSVSKKRSKSLTTTQLNRASPVPKPKIRGRKPSLHYDESEVFKCELCERRFKRQEHLKRHVSSLHMGERPYQCDICLKSFSRSDNLSQHKRIHNNSNGTSVQKRSSSTATNSRRVSART